jgi:class 3 adenylate cyclase/tetratricopeptide (TPR) repeat protein
VTTCTTCRSEAPDGARFCPSCGCALAVDPGTATERKVVTTLFADLVGFTALGERADPEDIDTALRSYYEMARDTIERFGGVVEKFIGDAVVGLFGVPAAHEDDAERAVRAALEIVAHMDGLPSVQGEPLRVRAAVNTGPALVRLRARPGIGEGALVGDAVNTAARLLAEAPPMGVVVGESTYRLTSRPVDYEAMAPLIARGKARPVPRWIARGAVARRGIDADGPTQAPMVGREVELGVLVGLMDRAIASRSPQFALISGEAGIGKSRLVREFFRVVDNRPGFLCTWRQGRCPPYGAELAYWSLREIVSAHAGVLQTDPQPVVLEKLLHSLGSDASDEILVSRLRPLVGLSTTRAEREEYFSAWTRFFESMAAARPTILVVEDLHWASEPTLAFLGHLARQAAAVPLLVIGTARPEYLDAHPTTAAFAEGVEHIALKALSYAECARLAASLPGSSTVPHVEERVPENCGGNPLFAEELVRYLVAQHQTDSRPEGDVSTSQSQVPQSVLSLIAARLDALPPDQKAILADAAVVGQVFWPGALCALRSEDPASVEETLRHLEAREFIRRSADSALQGEEAFVFWHLLIRDVAYEQLPRSIRAVKHAGLARWIEAIAGSQAGDLSEILAHHFMTAMELAQATHDETLADDLRDGTVRALGQAGASALPLDVTAAERFRARAADLVDADDPRRPYLLRDWAETLIEGGRFREAIAVLEESIRGLRAGGDDATAREAEGTRRYCDWLLGGGEAASDGDDAAVIDEGEPSPGLVIFLEDATSIALHAGHNERCLELANRAQALARQLGLPVPSRSLGYRGYARAMLGDEEGLDDMRQSVLLATERAAGHEVCATLSNLGECLALFEGEAAATEVHRQALSLARKRHDGLAECFCRALVLVDDVWSGRWETALAEGPDVIGFLEEHDDGWDLLIARSTMAHLLAWSGETPDAVGPAEWAEGHSRSFPLASVRQACLVSLATVRAAHGAAADALRLLDECSRAAHESSGADAALRAPEAVRLASTLGQPSLAQSLAGPFTRRRPFDLGIVSLLNGLLAEDGQPETAAEHFGAAARQWARLGIPYERAHATLARGRCLARIGHALEAQSALERARDIFADLGARPALGEAHALLGHSAT